MTRIVTIEREYGSGAAEIAQKLAARLGWKLWDQELTREIARVAHCHQSAVEQKEERRDSLYYRLLKSFARGSYEGSVNMDDPLQLLDADSIVRVSERVVRRAADEGNCVIVGRGSQHFLQDRADTLRFFLYAPKADKVRRLQAQGNKEKEAEALVDTVDRERAAFIKQYFNVDWPNRQVYHAMLNTAAGDEAVVRAMMSFVDRHSNR
ncbi:MAG TPA: cytidylate kinase-like family protein [Candidatus Angelobacter sp.]